MPKKYVCVKSVALLFESTILFRKFDRSPNVIEFGWNLMKIVDEITFWSFRFHQVPCWQKRNINRNDNNILNFDKNNKKT